MIFCSMLPQTTFKIWGIDDIPITTMYQFEYIGKYPNWINHREYIYNLNQLISEFNLINNFKQILTNSEIEIKDAFIDEQIFNRAHNFPNIKFIGERKVISYTSNTNNLTSWLDLKFGIEGARHIFRNYKFSKKVRPKEVYSIIFDWNKHMTKSPNLFWTNKFISAEKLKLKSRQFIQTNIKLFPEVLIMRDQHQTLLINPHVEMTLDQFKLWVKSKKYFFSTWQNSTIFIKHHRISSHIYPQEFRVDNLKFYTIPVSLTYFLPIEILIYSVINTKVITTASSLVALNQNVIIKLPISLIEKKDYMLMIKQIERQFNLEYIN